MYLWKNWRESRITFISSVGAIVLVSLLVLNASFMDPTFSPGIRLALPLCVLAWRFGSFGIGHHLDEGSATYLLLRPRSRAFFVWHDWCMAMLQLLLILIALDSAMALAGRHRHVPGLAHVSPSSFLPLGGIVFFHCVTDLLIVAFVFGLVYFCTVLLKLKGLLVSAGLLLGYPIAFVPLVRYYLPHLELPHLFLTEFVHARDGSISGFTDHLGIAIAVRVAVALIFPFAAILLLEQRDVT